MTVSLTIIKDSVTYDIANFGLALKKHNIPPNPDKEDFTFSIPGKPGKLRMGSQYKERQFSLECLLMADDATIGYQAKVAQIAELLDMINSPAYLIFGDMPGKRFLGEYTGSQTIDKMIFDGQLTIPMVCYFPFTETVTDVSNGWSYGDGYSYGMGMRYGDTYSNTVTVSGQTFKIYHAGGAPYPPQIKITGAFTNLSISDGTNTLTITRTNVAGDVVDIDCENFTYTLNGSTNIYAATNGVFFSLGKGETTFTVTGTGLNCVIQFTPFRHRYIY
jgi:phage-related protein